MENPVVYDGQSDTDRNTGFSIFHIKFFICHFPALSKGVLINATSSLEPQSVTIGYRLRGDF